VLHGLSNHRIWYERWVAKGAGNTSIPFATITIFFESRILSFFWSRGGEKQQIVKYPLAGEGTLAGRKGLILFEISGWSDAQGHVTLFDDGSCYDHCYFNEPEAKYSTSRANFWALP
jgi:hypothetical protein